MTRTIRSRSAALRRALPVAVAALAPTTALFAAPPPNDGCATPDVIVGNGIYNFDLTEATTGPEGQAIGNCGAGGMRNDVWFCWTAPSTGLVTLSTCGLTGVDTRIAIYHAGCACPAAGEAPFCCNDNACGKQSEVTCEVVCCEKYMVQVAVVPGGLPGPGQIKLQMDGDPCPDFPCDGVGGTPLVCDGCCGGRPAFTGFPGQIAIATQHRYAAAEFVVVAMDISGTGFNAPGTLSTPATYNHPSWTLANLGTVFGVTIDDVGNAYVAHSSSYYGDQAGVGGPGAVYKLDASTGAASIFATLPNAPVPGCFPPDCRPGLGNLNFHCATQNFYVSNFEDGRVYRLDAAGNVASTYDHATGTIAAGSAPEPGDAPGFAPLGERVWAVHATGGRLYYSVWVEDSGQPDAAAANEIWSIGLNGAGEFIGTAQLEILLPAYSSGPALEIWSNPVSDITFNADCCMVVAERSMSGDSSPGAHASRILEFCFGAAGWAPSSATFSVGASGLENSSSGGVDLDFAPGGLLWGTGDALQFAPDVIYGMAGLPPTGGNNASAILVDLDSETTQQDKTELGDVEIPCPPGCLVLSDQMIECDVENGIPTGDYDWTFTFTNNSGVTAQYLFFPDPAVSPNVLVLIPPVPNGGSATVSVTLSGLDPTLSSFCVDVVLADAKFNECCSITACVELPDCTCMLLAPGAVECIPGSGGAFNVSFAYIPLDFGAEYMFIVPPLPPDPNSGVTITPSFIDVSTPVNTAGAVGPIKVSGAVPGSEICLTVTIHSVTFVDCCSKKLCFQVPACAGDACPGDLNGDGLVDGADLGLQLAAWGSADAVADLNQDGSVDGADLGLLLSAWGPCG